MTAARHLAPVPEPGPAEPDSWDLSSYPLRYLRCRGNRHVFPEPEDTPARWTRVVGPTGRLLQWRRSLVCGRCTLMLTETIDARTGHRERTLPHYPDGYLRKGLGRLPVSDVRLEELRRIDAELGRDFDTVVEDG